MSKRDAYIQKLKAQLDEWNAELDLLEARSRKLGAEARIKYEEQMELLRSQHAEAMDRFAELQGATQDAWESLKEGIVDSWAALKAGLDRARSKLDL